MKFTVIIFAIAAAVVGHPSTADAKDAPAKVTPQPKVGRAKKGAAAGRVAAQAVPAGVTVNACGCYRSESGGCFCGDKNAACMCPGDCEPLACEQKRAREIEREVAAETKRAQDEEKRQEEAAAAAAHHNQSSEAAPISSGDSVIDEGDESAAPEKKADDPKPEKPAASKGRKHTVAKP